MENYKVCVSNEAESNEVQGLFDQLGFNCGEYWSEKIEPPFFIYNWNDGEFLNYRIDEFGLRGIKEITIDQLRNLVANQKTIGKIPYLVKTIDKWEEQQLTSDTPESATCLKIPDWGNSAYVHNDSVHFLFAVTVCEKTVWKRQPEAMHTRYATVKVSDGVLISGKDAYFAYLNGADVEFRGTVGVWIKMHKGLTLKCLDDYQFRLKPKTLTIGDKEYTKQEALDFIGEYFATR